MLPAIEDYVSVELLDRFIEQAVQRYNEPLILVARKKDRTVRFPSFASDQRRGGFVRLLLHLPDARILQLRFAEEVLQTYANDRKRENRTVDDVRMGCSYLSVPISVDGHFVAALIRPFPPRDVDANVQLANRLSECSRVRLAEVSEILTAEGLDDASTMDTFEHMNIVAGDLKALLLPSVKHWRQISIDREIKQFSTAVAEDLRCTFVEGRQFTLDRIFSGAISEIANAGGYSFLGIAENSALIGQHPALFGATISSLPEAVKHWTGFVEQFPDGFPRELRRFSRSTPSHAPVMDALEALLQLSGVDHFWLSELRCFAGSSFLFLCGMAPGGPPAKSTLLDDTQALAAEASEAVERYLNIFDALRALQSSIANTIHRIRVPMQLILRDAESAINEIKRGGAIDPVRLESKFDAIRKFILYQRAQTTGYMMFSVGEQGSPRAPHRPKPCVIGSILESTMEWFRVPDMNRGISVSVVEIAPEAQILRTMLDPVYLQIVFMNLLDNAVKYSFSGKEVWVRLLFIRKDGSDYWRFEVANFGLRIHPSEEALIFEPFYRAQLIRDAKHFKPGTGIGLAEVKRIVDDHGGSVRVDCSSRTAESQGEDRANDDAGYKITFTVDLPIRGGPHGTAITHA